MEFSRPMATNNFTRKRKAAACLLLMFMLEEEGKYDVTRAKRETKLELKKWIKGRTEKGYINNIVEELHLEDRAGSVK